MACNIHYEKIIFSIFKKSRINNEYYVFIGDVEENIRKILNKLENRQNIYKEEVSVLKNKYPNDVMNWVKIVKDKIKIYFLPYQIQIDDTISDIRKKIFIYLSNPEKKNYILPENQELWLEKTDGSYEIIGYYYENDKTKEKENFIPHIYEKFNEKNNEKINIHNFKKNTSENNLVIMDILEDSNYIKNIIYLSDAKEEEEYLKSKKINITQKIINNYFKIYWPYVNLSYDLNEIKNTYIIIKDYFEKENYIFKLMNSIHINSNEIGSCNLLNIIINVGNKNEKELLDLFQIFDYLKDNQLGTGLPFIKYYEESFDSPFSLISKKAVDEGKVDKDLLSNWLGINSKDDTRKTNGIQIKKLSKEYDNKPKYYSMLITKFGIVSINIGFLSEQLATFTDIEYTVNNCKNFINDINKNRVVKKIGEKAKIDLPHFEYKNEKIILNNTTKIKYMNIIIPLRFAKPINFKNLYDFTKKFPFFLVDLPKNILKKGQQEISENSMTIKYKRISGFVNMNDILFEIDKLKEKNIETGIIIKILEKKYQKSIEDIKSFLIEWEKRYASSKSSKISSEFKQGILVTITDNKILIKGITKIYHIPLLYKFFTTFMTVFMHYDKFMETKEFKKIINGKNINDNKIIYENSYEYNTNVKLNINKLNFADYNIENYYDYDEQFIKENDDDIKKNELISNKTSKIVGLLPVNDVGVDVKLTCNDAVPDKFTCKDFCNDEYYFIRRLQIFDSKLFKPNKNGSKENMKKYTKACQAKYQPVVMATDPDKDPRIKKDSYTYSIKYSSDPNLFDRWYICPRVWCPICEIPISEKDIDPKTIKLRETKNKGRLCKTGKCPFGNHLVIIKEKSNDIYPGFLSKDKHPQGLCLPCCYKKPKNIPGTPAYIAFKKCLGEENLDDTVVKDGEIYILGKGAPIEKDRYGKLSVDIERLLKTNLDTGYLKNKSGYLRKGINHTKNNSFLSAIADIISCDKKNLKMDVNKLKAMLIEKLNEPLFKSLHSGNLINIFYTMENYIKYLNNNDITITHKYLWDLMQRENVLTEEGVNLFIFENDKLLCPVGENVQYFFDNNKKNIIISKSNMFYEPVYHLEGFGKTTTITCIFDFSREEIKKIYDISQEGCKNKFYIDWLQVLKDNIIKYNLKIDNLVTTNGDNLQKTFNELLNNIKNRNLNEEYLPKLQYIDSYNKVFGLLLKNGLYLPVSPTKYNEKLPYQIVMDLNDIKPLSFKDTIKHMEELNKKTELSCKIVSKILDIKNNKKIIALVNENNRFIPIIHFLNIDKKLPISNLNYYSDIDESLFDKIEQIDERIDVINKKKYEDETYMRLKFELSKFLQLPENNKYLEKINEIIQSDKKNYSKNKSEMYILLNTIYSNLITIKNNIIDYSEYNMPNKRIPCFMRNITKISKISKKEKNEYKELNGNINLNCQDDPHCVEDKGTCKLFVNQHNLIYSDRKINNYNFYLSKIVDELLRYKLKRNEILKDNIPIIIDKEIIKENKNKYVIVHTINMNEIEKVLEKLFYDNNGIQINTKNLYEETTTKEIAFKKEKYLKTTIEKLENIKSNDLSIYWINILGNQFKIKIISNTNDSIFNLLEKIINLNEFKNIRNNTLFDINDIKKNIIDYIDNFKNKQKILNLYKNNTKLKNIPDILLLKHEILSEEYKGSEIDLNYISKIYNINFIILDKKIKSNTKGFTIIKSKNYKTDYFVILYKISILDKYMYIYNLIHMKNKIIFTYNDLPHKFINYIFKNNNTNNNNK
jgi:hypothetical protein